ncbi:MAG TPA: ATP-dependent Clp protease proteolytic subunit [Candidatus Angelobacter sp.]|nr:ATP-dependent Clp protease proteolytic subunit [Candidatus Angelobacter sp.]
MEFKKYAIKNQGISSLSLHYYEDSLKSFYESSITPYITEERKLNVAQIDVFSRLMMDRILFLGTYINDQVANIIQAQLLFLQSVNNKEIRIYINSPGGSVYSGFGIYDTMQMVSPDISTICTGMSASMAAVLLCAGTKGKRAGLKHSRIMLHQPIGGIYGPASDVEISMREINNIKREIYEIIALHSEQSFSKVEKDSDRDFWMTSEEALKYGIIDEVLGAE